MIDISVDICRALKAADLQNLREELSQATASIHSKKELTHMFESESQSVSPVYFQGSYQLGKLLSAAWIIMSARV